MRQWSKSFPTCAELKAFREALRTARVSDFTRMIFISLSSYPPPLRLAMNLKKFLGLSVLHEISNILADGVTEDERRALLELDRAGLSVHMREIAHGLFNIHERWLLQRRMAKVFREARQHDKDFDDTKPLDTILGDVR